METLYLAHHGIKGQKWGVRRFQNKDGSYTLAGKNRRSGQQNERADSTESHRLTGKQKRLLALGAAAVGTGLAVYGFHRYRDVLNDRTLKALAVEGKVIAEDPSNTMHMFKHRIPNQALITNKQITLNQRVRAYEGSKDPVKIVADIITKRDYLKEHEVARSVSRGRTSIWDNSKPFGTDYQFRLYNVGENPGKNPNLVSYEFDPKIRVGDVVRGVKKRRSVNYGAIKWKHRMAYSFV